MFTRVLVTLLVFTATACSSSSDATDAAVDASDKPLSCEERIERSSNALAQVIDDASLSCSSASDCVDISTSTACHAACGALVGAADVPHVEAAIAEQDATTCAGFETDGCERLIPPCIPPPPFDCIDQRCTSTGE